MENRISEEIEQKVFMQAHRNVNQNYSAESIINMLQTVIVEIQKYSKQTRRLKGPQKRIICKKVLILLTIALLEGNEEERCLQMIEDLDTTIDITVTILKTAGVFFRTSRRLFC